MKKIRHISVTLLTLLVSLIFVPVVSAHPLGNFTINQYVGLIVNREYINMDYVLDMAEIPAFQEITRFDTNGNGQPDASEFSGYALEKCASLQPDFGLFANNASLTLVLTNSSVEFPNGVGGLPTLRLVCDFQAPLDSVNNLLNLSFVNNAFPERIGWKEIVVITDGVSVLGDFATTSLSDRLTNYPQDLLTSPLDQRQVDLEIASTDLSTKNDLTLIENNNKTASTDRNDAFTRLILLDEITLPKVLLALAISFIWGAMHAMTPGHGKTIVGAYLVGSRGTMKHAVYLGLTTTLTHTLGVFALGLATLFAAKYIVPEKLFPWMSLLSGVFVVGIGLNLAWNRFRSLGAVAWLRTIRSNLMGARQAHMPSLQYISVGNANQQHKYVLHSAQAGHHFHSHVHPHMHDNDNHDHHHRQYHDHADHSHMPPGADGSPVTWRSLLMLGVSGGIIPCPSALVVLLGAIALNKIGFGLILVLAFSLGLAGALTAIGMMFIYAGRLFNRFPSQGRLIEFLPIGSALIVSGLGLVILVKAAAEIGWI